ncbi:unnamed protein product [Parajaminaea phylloscopi]
MRPSASSSLSVGTSLSAILVRPTASSAVTTFAPSRRSGQSPCLSGHIGQRRNLFGLFKKSSSPKAVDDPANPWRKPKNVPSKPILEQDDLFHPLSTSPIADLRARAERIKRIAPCPVHLRRGQKVNVNFDCPDCGWPTHHSEKEWREDEEHGRYVLRLREANEDEHDLRSGREMHEFRMPGPQGFEEAINFSSWDVFFYTRNFPSIESERSRRHVSKLLTFPASMAGVLHENSPYTTRNRRMTREGTRSFLALRQMLHPIRGAKPSLDSVRVFVVGARAESTLPTTVWDQLRFMFPGVNFHIYLIGPEVTLPSVQGGTAGSKTQKTRPSTYGPQAPSKTIVVSEGLTMTYIQSAYEDVHHQMDPFDPYSDVFFAFSPGFGFPSQKAYDPVASEDGELNASAVTAKSTPSEEASETGQNLDAVAARFESREEVQSQSTGQSTGRELPDASSTIGYQSGESSQADGEAPASTANNAVDAATQATSSPQAEQASSPKTISHLPALPPLLQAQSEWAQALTQMLSTKCPIVVTGFSPADVRRDVEAFESVEGIKGEFEWLVTPGENVFGSLSWSIADFDPRVAVKANWGVWAVRGKRYDLQGPGAFVNPFSTRKLNEEGE